MTEATYYFNSKGTDVWSNAAYIIDNILTNYAYTDVDGAIQLVTGNTCPGTNLGAITKVELRVYVYGDGNDRIDLIPVFGGSSDGDTHQTTPGVSAGWGIYQDITNDTNHPSPWAWSDVQSLDSKIIKEDVAKGNIMYCAKVEIRVTYSIVVGWLAGYAYRKRGAINATTAGAQTNYQCELKVGESSGATGENVDCAEHCLNFPNDIRFTNQLGETKHDYWVESISGATPNRLATVHIEVAVIPASGDVDFYMYYGKSSDSGESNGDNTFEFFDAFGGDLSKWTDDSESGSIVQIESGELSMDARVDEREVLMSVTTPTYTMPFAVDFNESEVGYYVDTTNWMAVQICMSATTDWVLGSGHSFILKHNADYSFIVDSVVKLSNVASGITPTTKHKVTFRAINGHLWVDLDNINKVNWTGTTTRTAGYIGVRNFGFHHHIDDFRIRKYSSPEPTWGSWNTEEGGIILRNYGFIFG